MLDRETHLKKNTTFHKCAGESTASRVCSIFFSLLITVYMLSIPSSGYEDIDHLKYILFLCFTLAFVFVQMELMLIGNVQKSITHVHWADYKAQFFLLLYFLFTVISGLMSAYPGVFLGNGWHDGILTIGLYIICSIFLTASIHPQKWMLHVFGVSVSLFCLLGFVQLTGKNPFGLYPFGYHYYDAGIYYASEFWSTIGNTDLCAALLSISTGAFFTALIRRRQTGDWLFAIPLLLSVVSLLEIRVEAGIVALLAGAFLILPYAVISCQTLANAMLAYAVLFAAAALAGSLQFFNGGIVFTFGSLQAWETAACVAALLLGAYLSKKGWFQNARKTQFRHALLALIGVVGIAAVFVLYFYNHFTSAFLEQAHQILHGNWKDEYGSGRIYIWRQVLEVVKEKPLLGGGPDTLSYRGLEGFSRYSETLGIQITSLIDAAHNEYLNILVNQGALALAAYLAFLAASLIHCWKESGTDSIVIGGGAVLFYLIWAFFGISSVITAPFFWIALAFMNQTGQKGEEI